VKQSKVVHSGNLEKIENNKETKNNLVGPGQNEPPTNVPGHRGEENGRARKKGVRKGKTRTQNRQGVREDAFSAIRQKGGEEQLARYGGGFKNANKK